MGQEEMGRFVGRFRGDNGRHAKGIGQSRGNIRKLEGIFAHRAGKKFDRTS